MTVDDTLRALIERAKQGDRDAFGSLVDGRIDRLYAIAYRILRSAEAAEDALQNAFLDAWRDLPRLRDPDRFDAWLRRLLVNACIDEAKRRRTHRLAVAAVPVEPAAADSSEAIAARDELERAFRHLRPEHRAVVVLHHFADLPLREVAEALGISVGTAKSRLHYALQGLRAAVEAEGRLGAERGQPV